jgi:hypothetical protein
MSRWQNFDTFLPMEMIEPVFKQPFGVVFAPRAGRIVFGALA